MTRATPTRTVATADSADVAPPAEPALGPLAAPTPWHALGAEEIAPEQHFRRDHFPAPRVDSATWRLQIGGHVRRPMTLDLDALRAFGARSPLVTLECAGHRRTEHDPCPPGLPWGVGAVAEGRWTGAPLAAVLRRAGVLAGATAVVLEGADSGAVPTGAVEFFARAVPLSKAGDGACLLAWAHGGDAIAPARGGPVRAIVPGWYATESVKWLTRMTVVVEPFGGYFEAHDYRFRPPGEAGPGRRLDEVPVNALITTPADGRTVTAGRLRIGGIAWGGGAGVARVDVRIDDEPWRRARLGPRRGAFARRFWAAEVEVDPGRHVISARARDGNGACQPERPPANDGGFANNAIHRVRLSCA